MKSEDGLVVAHTFKTSTWGSVRLILAWFTKKSCLKRNKKKKKRKKETKRRRKKKKVGNGKQSQV